VSITREQVKAARNLLDWWQSDLADGVGVSEGTIRSFESGELRASLDLDRVRFVLESVGVEFPVGGAVLRKGG